MSTILYEFKPAWSDTFNATVHKKALKRAFKRYIDAHKGKVRLREVGGKTGPWRTHAAAKQRFFRRVLAKGDVHDQFVMEWKDAPAQAETRIRVVKDATKADIVIAICEAHLGLRYVLGGLSWFWGTDCSGQTKMAIKEATDGKIDLYHKAAIQMNDPRVKHIGLAQAKRGDLMFFHNGAHVAFLHHKTDDGHYFVIDEEPSAEPGVPSGIIYGGLHVRPGYPGYYVGPENIDFCGRIEAINGPV